MKPLCGAQKWVCALAPAGFIVSARTENGDVEAIESTEKTFVIGTQFHPEMVIYDPRAEKVLQAYIAAAKAYSERKYYDC